MRYTARVIRHTSAETLLQLRKEPAPASCAHCGMCTREEAPSHGGSIRAYVSRNPDLSPGQCVLVDARIPSDALIAGLLFGLPLVCMLIVVFLCVVFLPQRESFAVAGSVAGLVLGYALGVMLHSLVPAFKVRIDSVTRPHASPASAHTITDTPRTVKE